jgi:hypothetical protein
MKISDIRERWRQLPPGPWLLATSCSWRRIVTEYDHKTVIMPARYSKADPQPTLDAPPGVLEAVVEARTLVPELLDMVEDLQSKLTETIVFNGQMLACSQRVRVAFDEQQARLDRYKQRYLTLHHQRESLPPRVDPADVLSKIADLVKEPMECGHPIECWDTEREVCVWCAFDSVIKRLED